MELYIYPILIWIPGNIEREAVEDDDDDVEQTVLGEEGKVELEIRELDRKEDEEYIDEEIDDKDFSDEESEVLDKDDEDSSHRQSSVVVKLTQISKVN